MYPKGITTRRPLIRAVVMLFFFLRVLKIVQLHRQTKVAAG
jgi:hypothetical protein